ncbi:uncharacterized protein LOC108600702 isoform X8 [Drosophila busckii]|uniref:uncharacterized protein LOC108600702 isoform X8 n=1 Tax=Drosophila busckii TaxID=30019 RepID=UPI00083EF492|nr:uncharacterized protein LOC108600702 isoform X8 [Drosophila busckii]
MTRAALCMVVACILMQCAYSAKYDAENRRLIVDINDQKTTNQQYYSSNFDTSK